MINSNNSATAWNGVLMIHYVKIYLVTIITDYDLHVNTNNNVFNNLYYTPVKLVHCDIIVSLAVSDNISSPTNPS